MGDYYGHGGGSGSGAAAAVGNNKPPRTLHQTTSLKPAQPLPPGTSAPGSSLQHSDHVKIFVGGLSWQTTEESLRWHFETYGEVVSVEVMRDRVTGDPRGFAFVVFNDAATVDLVMIDKDKHEINHKFVDVKRAQARGVAPPSIHERQLQQQQQLEAAQAQQLQSTTTTASEPTSSTAAAGAAGAGANMNNRSHAPTNTSNAAADSSSGGPTPEQMQTKVFVGGIPPHVGRDELKQIFSQFGDVVDAIVMVDQVTQRSRGFGFVTFCPQQTDGTPGSAAAERSIRAQPLDMHGRQVEVKLATPRAEPLSTAPNGAAGSGDHHHNNKHHHAFQQQRSALPPGPKHVGLRAGQPATTTGEFAGLAVAYGRNGWKAGYGTKAFGKAGWDVWEDTLGDPPTRAGFSFALLNEPQQVET